LTGVDCLTFSHSSSVWWSSSCPQHGSSERVTRGNGSAAVSTHTHDDMETLHRSCWWSRGFLKLSVDHSLVHV